MENFFIQMKNGPLAYKKIVELVFNTSAQATRFEVLTVAAEGSSCPIIVRNDNKLFLHCSRHSEIERVQNRFNEFSSENI